MEPDLVNEFVPGDQTMQLQGIQPLLPREDLRGDLELPTIKELASNAIKNKAINYAAGKLGLNTAASGILSVLGMGANVISPLIAASALSGKSLGISNYLANKRAQKQYAKSENMLEAKVLSNELANQSSPRDDAMGGANIPSKTSTPAATQSRQTSGIGGLHSGY